MFRLVLFYLLKTLFIEAEAQLICEVGYCENYVSETGCSSPQEHCSINNGTHSGDHLLSPTPCNCCEYCLPTYGLGDHCSLGGVGDGNGIGRCGDGLTCVAGDDGNFCERISASVSECHALQDDYDERYERGEIGALELRPLCDRYADYAHYHCIPTQTCFCQSETGERLFGEILYSGRDEVMDCACTLLHEKIKRNLNPAQRFPVIGPRCSADGGFHPVQCLDRICYCVDRVTGVIDEDHRVDLDEKPISDLPCYDMTLDFTPDQNKTAPHNYTTPCVENLRHRIKVILESEELGFNVDYFSTITECCPDGSYGRVLEINNYTSKICVNEMGERIDDYQAEKGTQAYEEMNCYCAVTSQLMGTALEKPSCCSNGNFRQVQCRRGVCRCLQQDGRQIGRENSDITKLDCYTADWKNC